MIKKQNKKYLKYFLIYIPFLNMRFKGTHAEDINCGLILLYKFLEYK